MMDYTLGEILTRELMKLKKILAIILFVIYLPLVMSGTRLDSRLQECPGLDSKLCELILMVDPMPLAEQFGFRVLDGKVQVVLVLVSKDTAIPAGFDLDVGTRVGNQVQVFAPFNVLCDLANTDEVIAIRQPMVPILEQTGE